MTARDLGFNGIPSLLDAFLNGTSNGTSTAISPNQASFSQIEPRAGFEPATAALPRRCPTRLGYRGARTHISDGTVFYALRIPEAQTLNGIEESANDHSRIGSYSYFGER